MLCDELDVRSDARLAGRNRGYGDWFEKSSEDYRAAVTNGLEGYGPVLSADLIAALRRVQRSILIELGVTYSQRIAFQSSGIVADDALSPPLLCWGASPLAEESLEALRLVLQALRSEMDDLGMERWRSDWLSYPDHYRQRYLGTHRFSPQALEEWRRDHPNAKPIKFGRGNPNKDPQLDPRSPEF